VLLPENGYLRTQQNGGHATAPADSHMTPQGRLRLWKTETNTLKTRTRREEFYLRPAGMQ